MSDPATTPTLTARRQATAAWFGRRFTRTSTWYAGFNKNLGAAAVILAVIAASTITLAVAPLAGVIVNAAALAALIALALWDQPIRKVAISAAILPAALMLSVSLPPTDRFTQSVILYDTLLLLALVYRYIFTLDEPVATTRLTLRGYAFALPLMVVLGQLLGLLAYGVLRHHYPYTGTSTVLVAGSVIVFALTEEMLFRGLIQQQAVKVVHPVVAAMLSASVFALASVNHVTIITPFYSLALGAVLAATYYKKPNLILTTTINATAKLLYLGLLAIFVLH